MTMKKQLGFLTMGVAMTLIFAISANAALVTYADAKSKPWKPGQITLITSTGDALTEPPGHGGWQVDGSQGHNGTSIESVDTLVQLELTTIVNGLTPGAEYNMYAYFMAGPNSWQDGSIEAGLTSGALQQWSRDGGGGMNNAPALLLGVDGTDNRGMLLDGDVGVTNTAFNIVGSYFDSAVLSQQFAVMHHFEASLGTAIADGNGEINVYINHTPNAAKTVYDGVGYSLVPEPGTLALVCMAGLMGLVARRRER